MLATWPFRKSACYKHSTTKIFQRQKLFAIQIIVLVLAVTFVLWNRQSITNHFRTRPIDIHGLNSYPAHLPRARQVRAQELIHRNVTKTNQVSRIIHQSWEGHNIPKKWATWSDSWRVKHPDWEWVLWTNEDNRALVEARAPWLLETYDTLPGEIRRADVVRNLYMLFFGGVYADLDVECLRSHDSLFDSYNSSTNNEPVAFFGRMGSDPTFRDSLPNAWMASSSAHPFFWLPLSYVQENSKHFSGSVEALTGPIALREQVKAYETSSPSYISQQVQQSLVTAYPGNPPEWSKVPAKHTIVILNETLIYPYSWNSPRLVKSVCDFNEFDFDPLKCQDLLHTAEHESYSITYWSHSWTKSGHNSGHLGNAG